MEILTLILKELWLPLLIIAGPVLCCIAGLLLLFFAALICIALSGAGVPMFPWWIFLWDKMNRR